jgi:transcription-repair coupling factor (superfamily II helicase)
VAVTLQQTLQSLSPGLASLPELPLLTLQGLSGSARAYFIARLFAEQRLPLFIVTSNATQRDQLCDDLQCLLSHVDVTTYEQLVLRYSHHGHGPESVASEHPAQPDYARYVYQPLWRLLQDEPVIVVTAVASLRYCVLSPALLQVSLLPLSQTHANGRLQPLDQLVAEFVGRGYQRVPMVEQVGEFSIRGDIVDIFSPGQRHPRRIELFGDEIETIRTFDVVRQTSLTTVQDILIAPVHPLSWQPRDTEGFEVLGHYLLSQAWSESLVANGIERWASQSPAQWPWGIDTFFYQTLSTPLAYLPAASYLCCVDAEEIDIMLQHLPPPDLITIGEARAALPASSLLNEDELAAQLREKTAIVLKQHALLPTIHEAEATPLTVLPSRRTPQFFGVLERLITQLQQWQAEGYCTLILCRFALEVQRMQSVLASYDLGSHPLATCHACLFDEALQPGAILLSTGELSQGFILPDLKLVVLREDDIFGNKSQETKRASRQPQSAHQAIIDFGSLKPGDRVVHVDYGIGRYRGMTFLDTSENRDEFMELEYADGATLYVPGYRLSVVQKYSGGHDDNDRLDRLGSAAWTRTKARVRESLLAMAGALVEVHAARQAEEGFAFSPAGTLHQEFDGRFEFVETEDQIRAIQDVMEDMERPRPMERLVCGDVGYGKTEVAIRAAFKAVYDGKQVAILVPTTVLAQQHYDTFCRRFAAFPVHLGMLSRMRSRKQLQETLGGLREGTVDIVIGTHRLLQKDVVFKSLGLLVVDEEHRFGVAHKERIKQMSMQVDVLMLSATPIPRSLHMTLMGLRDFSAIETPPEGRSAIQTIVAPFSREVIQNAIRQELARGGQIFFVHNRIDTLPAMQMMLAELVPECRVSYAHGQMPERQLENMMLQFLNREFDLLLCTTIIESGLDIASVNTIIINHAERFGLAQLYQLRGRVGRGTRQAYAYLLIPGDLLLSDDARKRIEAIEEFSELGSGFQLATRDLEIRGAGNLLGPQQSGHIASVGFDLYCQMLSDAIQTTRGETVRVRVDPELRLDIQGHIPTTYVVSEAQRLELYRRLATVENEGDLKALQQEMRDRFGPLPVSVTQLFAIVALKILARQLALERIETKQRSAFLTFHPQTPVDSAVLLRWLEATETLFQFQSDHVVRLPLKGPDVEARLTFLKKHLQRLQASVSL